KQDPVGCFEAWLTAHGTGRGRDGKILASTLEATEAEVIREVDAAAEEALRSRDLHSPRPEQALGGVTADEGARMKNKTVRARAEVKEPGLDRQAMLAINRDMVLAREIDAMQMQLKGQNEAFLQT